MGGRDKGLIEIAGKPMIEYVMAGLGPQVKTMIINANRNLSAYLDYGLPVIADEFSGFNGPLAGMASCMRVVDTKFMVSVPCDSPFLPYDLVARLYKGLKDGEADVSVAHDGKRMQPVFSLLKTELLDSLTEFLNRDEHKIDKWFDRHKTVTTDFSDQPETFMNINTPEDIGDVESKLVKL